MKFRFIWLGATRDASMLAMENRYLERLGNFCPAERVVVREASKRDPRQIESLTEREARRLEAQLQSRAYVVCLDEKGTQRTSRQLARHLQDLAQRGQGAVDFLVGSHDGLPDRIRGSSNELLALGRMTLPHELARVVLLEQVYRAMTIARGLPYHK